MEPLTQDTALAQEWLAEWVQPQHLEDDALRRYRDMFLAPPMPVTRVDDFLQEGCARQLATFLQQEAQYEEVYCLYNPEGCVSEEAWHAADPERRLGKYQKVQGARADVRSFGPLLYRRFTDVLEDQGFIAFFEALTGLALGPLQAVGGKAFGREDMLRPHSDDELDRRLAFILYLTPDWRAEYGGALFVEGANGETMRIEARFNSLVLFDVKGHARHWISDIGDAAGSQRRLSIGGWVSGS